MLQPKTLSEKLLLLLAIIILSTGIGIILIGVMLWLTGDLKNLIEYQNISKLEGNIKMKTILLLNHLTTFILSAYLCNKYVLDQEGKKYILKGNINASHMTKSVIFYLTCLPLAAFLSYFIELIHIPKLLVDMSEQNELTIFKLLKSNNIIELLFTLLVVAIIPGIGEELLFRGILQKIFLDHMKPYCAIALSSFIFAALHLDPTGIATKWLIGFALGIIYYRTKNIWISIIIHICNNAVPVLLLSLSQKSIRDIPSDKVGSSILIVGLIFIPLAYISYNRLKQETNYG
jgi:hypothetical protein